jgi:hypothetical protein
MRKSFETINAQLRLQQTSNYEMSYDFDKFYRTFSREFKKLLTSLGCTNVKLSKGYFFLSGFFTCPNGQVVYVSLEDWRWMTTFLIRKAKSYKDSTGGGNEYLPINQGAEQFISKLRTFLVYECKVKMRA